VKIEKNRKEKCRDRGGGGGETCFEKEKEKMLVAGIFNDDETTTPDTNFALLVCVCARAAACG